MAVLGHESVKLNFRNEREKVEENSFRLFALEFAGGVEGSPPRNGKPSGGVGERFLDYVNLT